MERVVLPGMIILLSHWFSKAERSRANTFLILGNPITMLWMSVVSGYLVQSIGWRGMFVVEGAPPILWAVALWFLVEDRPAEAHWLAPADREALERALAEEQRGIVPVRNYSEAFRSPAVLLLATQYFCRDGSTSSGATAISMDVSASQACMTPSWSSSRPAICCVALPTYCPTGRVGRLRHQTLD